MSERQRPSERITEEGPAGSFRKLRFADVPTHEAPRILFGTLGRRGLALAGRVFDGVILHPFLTTAAVEKSVEIVRSSAVDAGRDPSALRVVSTLVAAPELAEARLDIAVRARAISYFQVRGLGEQIVERLGFRDQRRLAHQAGDVALKITAHCLKAALRSADVACRYGGEEFCILLPQTTATEAAVIAERMRQRVTETDYPHGKSQPKGTVSISIGISAFAKPIATAEKVRAAADRALYHAEHMGKNRIEFYVDNMVGSFAAK